MRSIALALPAAFLSFASMTLADDGAAPKAPRTDEALHVEVGADAWFARLLGEITGGGVTRDIKALDLRDSEVAFAGHGRLTLDRCFAEISGFTFDTDGDYSAGGDSFRTDFQWWGASVDLGYALLTPFADASTPWSDGRFDAYGDNVNEDGSYRLDLRISPTLGLSYHDVELNDLNVTQSLLSSTDGSWMTAQLGAELELRLRPGGDFAFLKEVIISAQASVGPSFGIGGDASGGGVAFELDAGVDLMFHENVGARLGYRLTDAEFSASDSASDLELGLYGLYAGVAIRF
jgi:opacity protein-like surface antigen